MKNKFFSVIVTTYNSSKYIEKTINSILKQNFLDYEIILVDDCSNDDTIELVKKQFSNHVKILSTDKNFGGPAKSRNIGIQYSSGQWISFLDADDFWFQSRLKQFHKYIINNPNFEVFCSNEMLYNLKNKKKNKINHGPYSENFFDDLLIKGNRLSPSATVINKEFIFKNKIFFDIDKNLIGVEDYDLWLNLSKKKARFFFFNKILSLYVIHENNITHNSKKHLENTINVLNKNFKLLNSFNNKIYSKRIFDLKVSFLINELLKNNHFFLNTFNFFILAIKNPINLLKFLFNKLR